MASRKPAIGFGPITDDLAKMLAKAAKAGRVGSAKRAQAKRIVSRLEQRGGTINKSTGEIFTKSGVKANKTPKSYIKQVAPADPAYAAKRAASKKASAARSKQVKKNAIESGAAQRQIEINANKKKLNRKADRILNTIDLAEKRGAGKATKNKRGKMVIYPEKAQGAQRSRAGAVGGGYKQANIRNKAKAEEFKAAIRAEKDAKKRAALRAKARAHYNETGF